MQFGLKFHRPDEDVREHKKIIAELSKHTRKWFKLWELGSWWELHIHFERVPKDNDGKEEDITWESASAATEIQPEYGVGKITYFIEALIEKDRLDQLEIYAKHEILHVVLSPYTKLAEQMILEMDPRPGEGGLSNSLLMIEETLISRLENLKMWDKL